MKKLFGNWHMTWLRTIVFAAATGIYTGLVMCVPFLENTSFQDIGIAYEWWVIFAVIVVTHCGKVWEAGLKCFVFFLISQPLVYLTEAALGELPLDMGWHYYSSIWLPMTLLTLPGGCIAYFCKKQNLFGSIILGLGNTIQFVLGVAYLLTCLFNFPRHLLSALVCFGSMIVMSFGLQKQKKYRAVAIIVPVVMMAVLAVFLKISGRVLI